MQPPRFFAALEADAKELLRDLADGWTAEEIASIRGDIECGEWGLAVEQVAGGIVRLNRPLTGELLARIDNLARRTNMTTSVYLRQLHARARQLGIRRKRLPSAGGNAASRTRSRAK
jgi:hypothetical protein